MRRALAWLQTDHHETAAKLVFQERALTASALRSIAVSAAVVIVTGYILLSRAWVPSFDDALIWLHTLDVGGRHSPLIGPYSRFGWFHPGPMLYYVLAVAARLSGRLPTSLLVGSYFVALVSTCTAVSVAARQARFAGTITLALGLCVLLIGLGDRTINPWNPFILVLPFTAFVFAAWMWSAGERYTLPVLAVFGSFAAQSHLGVCITVAAIIMAAFVLRRLSGAPRDSTATLASTALILAAVWAPPLWEQCTSPRGNLSHILMFFFGNHAEPSLGFRAALGIAAREFGPWGSWTGYEHIGLLEDIEPLPAALLLAPAASLLATALFAVRWRDSHVLRVAAITAAGLLATLYSYAKIHGPPHSYLVVWPRALAMLCWVAPLTLLGRRFFGALPDRMASAYLGPTLCVLSVVLSVRSITATLPDATFNRILLRFAPQIIGAAPRGTYVRVAATGVPFTVSAEPLAVMLIQAGRLPGLATWDPNVPGKHRVVPHDAALPTIAVASGAGIDQLQSHPGGKVIAEYDPLTPAQRAEAKQMHDALEPQFRASGRLDLLTPLESAERWLLLFPPATVDRELLQKYVDLASGDDRRAYAAFFFAETTW